MGVASAGVFVDQAPTSSSQIVGQTPLSRKASAGIPVPGFYYARVAEVYQATPKTPPPGSAAAGIAPEKRQSRPDSDFHQPA